MRWKCPLCIRESDQQDEIQEHIYLAHQIYPVVIMEDDDDGQQ